MAASSSPEDTNTGRKEVVRFDPDASTQQVRAPKTDALLDELNNHIFEIGADIKVLINEVKELKEAIKNLSGTLKKSEEEDRGKADAAARSAAVAAASTAEAVAEKAAKAAHEEMKKATNKKQDIIAEEEAEKKKKESS
jgi:hypothetical protein